MTSEEFESQYKRLNKAQKEAVDAIEGPVMVAAGPGTGKTQILALRIANILLKTDTKPDNILCLTFTESGVFSMRRRLAQMIGNAAYRVAINTFHGFCNNVISERPEDFPKIIGAVNITEVDQVRVLEEVLDSLKLEKLTTFGDPYYYLKSIQSSLGQLKQEGVTPDEFRQEMERSEKEFWALPDLYSTKKGYEGKLKSKYDAELKRLEKNKELALVYEAYEKKLREHKYYDFNDMIMEVLRALSRDKDLLLSLQENYQYILVDEHQDTNNAQNRILELLASFYDAPNLFVVGDEKQAIFRFQGASLENFLYFKHKYPAAKFIVLEDNYRSSQSILDSAHSLLPGEKKLQAKNAQLEQLMEVYEFSSQPVEEYFLAKNIQEKIAAGEKPEEIAIIYRENRDAWPIAKMLEKVGVPFVIESSQDLLDDSDVKKLIKIFQAINHFGDDLAFFEVLHIDFLGLDPLQIHKFIELAGRKKIGAFDLAKKTKLLTDEGIEEPDKFFQVYTLLAELNKLAANEDVALVFETTVRESGLLSSILNSSNSVEKIGKINALFNEVQALIEKKRSARLADFMEYLALLDKHEIRLKKNSEGARPGRVRLMTAHGSKGLEFDHVYIAYANDKHWGNKTHRDLIKLPARLFSLSGQEPTAEEDDSRQSGENADERRLFYVAITRAKKTVTISYSRQDKEKKELLPAMFLEEMDKNLLKRVSGAKYEQDFLANLGLQYLASQTEGVSVDDKEFIRDLFKSRGFAVTHLNNYLSCPWKYFYMNLLRLPHAEERHLMYGTAIHAALCDFFEQFKENDDPSKEYLLAAYHKHLACQPIPEGEYGVFQKRGEEALSGYFDNYHGTWRTNVLTEFDIKGIILTSDIVLTGKIDKIEFLGDGNKVNVVDYKTGKPKSRNKIEGMPSTGSAHDSGGRDDESEGGIKRQLAYYNLLLNRYDNGRYKMVSGDIDFVEPNQSGKYKKESFLVTPEDIAELETLIKRVANEIINFEFWDKRCDDPNCEFCALRGMIKKPAKYKLLA